jgi:membrane protease YdiL (CAAX protease family)
MALIAAPVSETLIGQQLQFFFVSEIYQTITQHIGVTFSTILFSWMHSSYSIWYAIAVIPAGLYLRILSLYFKRKSPVSG